MTVFQNPQIFSLEGQEVQYLPNPKTLLTTINKPWNNASRNLGWKDTKYTIGFGFNLSIIEFLKKYKPYFVVRVGTSGNKYWIKYDKLKQFMDTHKTFYKAKKNGMEYHVFPMEIFTRSQEVPKEE